MTKTPPARPAMQGPPGPFLATPPPSPGFLLGAGQLSRTGLGLCSLTSCGARLKSSWAGAWRYSVLFPQMLQVVFSCAGDTAPDHVPESPPVRAGLGLGRSLPACWASHLVGEEFSEHQQAAASPGGHRHRDLHHHPVDGEQAQVLDLCG